MSEAVSPALERAPWLTPPPPDAHAAFSPGDRVRFRGVDGCAEFAAVLDCTPKGLRVHVDAVEGKRNLVPYDLIFGADGWPDGLALDLPAAAPARSAKPAPVRTCRSCGSRAEFAGRPGQAPTGWVRHLDLAQFPGPCVSYTCAECKPAPVRAEVGL